MRLSDSSATGHVYTPRIWMRKNDEGPPSPFFLTASFLTTEIRYGLFAALRFAVFPFPLPLFELISETPAVFWLPLSLVTTPTLEGAFREFRFWLTLAFVSTTPFLVALLLFELVSPPHAESRLAVAKKHKARVCRIFSPLLSHRQLR